MTIQYNFDQPIDRQSSDSIKWHYFDPQVLPMWVADMDFRSPEPVIQALHARVEHGVFGYPEFTTRNTDLMSALSSTIVERMSTLYHWSITPDDILYLPGVVVGFDLACHAFGVTDSAVFFQTPVYYPILHTGKETGIQTRQMELTCNPDRSYSIDWDRFEERLDEATRLFILCNPHNPVGRVFRKDELLKTAEICLRRGITICSDEIHCDLVFSDHSHIPIASLDAEIAQNSITLMAPSKTFNLAGLQCSFAIIQNPDLRTRYQKATKGLVPWVNLMGLHAALAAYQEGGEWLSQLLVYLQANRDYLVDYVRTNLPGVKIASPEGTYLAWLDCHETGIEGSPAKFFVEKAQVGMNEGAMFGAGGEGFVRLNFGCPRSQLTEGLERMRAALQTL